LLAANDQESQGTSGHRKSLQVRELKPCDADNQALAARYESGKSVI
jgi:hypothetical protein